MVMNLWTKNEVLNNILMVLVYLVGNINSLYSLFEINFIILIYLLFKHFNPSYVEKLSIGIIMI